MARCKGTATFEDGTVLFFIFDAKRGEAIPRLYAAWDEVEAAWETARAYPPEDRVPAAEMEAQPCALRADNGVAWQGLASKKRKLIADDYCRP
jgi:hypothetical protein